MIAVIYARYSNTIDQDEAIEKQLLQCREYAENNNIEVIDEYVDRGLSATTNKETRPEFLRMINDSHHWVNDDPNTYYDISNSVRRAARIQRIDKKRLSAFDLDGYQVVRGQFMQLRYEGPAISISNERVTFNKFCVQKFEN